MVAKMYEKYNQTSNGHQFVVDLDLYLKESFFIKYKAQTRL